MLKTVIKKYSVKTKGVIHVGAHYGEEVEDYLGLSPELIVLFEPLEENFRLLTENIARLKTQVPITLHQVALGNENTCKDMVLSSNGKASSSLLAPSKILEELHPEVKFSGYEKVEVKRLDDFGYKECNFLNIDVQGYELEVLKGATETLKHVDYIYAEVNNDELYKGGALIEQIDHFLGSYGFERLETVWCTRVWGEAFYVKGPNK